MPETDPKTFSRLVPRAGTQYHPKCFLARYGAYDGSEMPPCDGRLVRAHLVPQQLLKRTEAYRAGVLNLWDDRLWVPACGGWSGCAGHHGAFDVARTIRLPYECLPGPTVRLARTLGLEWWIDREYARARD